MSDCLDEHSAAATLSLAAKFSCDSLQAYTQQYIVAKFHTMRPDALKECTRAVFWDLISRDDLSIYSELQVCASQPPVIVLLLQWIQVTAPMSILSAVFQQNRKSGSQACLKLCRDHACNFSRQTELQEPTEAGRGPHSTATFLFQAPPLPCHEGVA